MNKKFYLTFFLLFINFFICGNTVNKNKKFDPKKEKKLLELIINTLQKSHFDLKKIDDNFSRLVFKSYINLLDAEKKFFLEADFYEFKKSENLIDDQILNNDLTFFYLTYDRIKIRMQEAKEVYTTLGKNNFDFSLNESFNPLQTSFQTNQDGIRKIWRLRMKKNLLDSIAKQSNIETIKQKIDAQFKAATINELEKKFRINLLKYYSGTDIDIENLERQDFFEKYINAILSQFDPHTKYLKPAEKLEQSYLMSGQYIGIGTQTAYIDNFLQVYKLEKGGPAWRDKKLEIGDIILKFQDGNNEQVDLVGLSLLDYNKLIANVKKNVNIKLTVKKPDGSIKVVTIKKDIIEIGNTFAKSCIVEKDNKKIGIINLPKFYKDFNDSSNRDASSDVATELEILKKEGVKGVLLDLRNNGGGSVEEAIELLGLFLNKENFVQLMNSEKKLTLLSNQYTTKIWDGPLTVLINDETASASEIFAAAIQDYKRGLIIGSKSSFGKGTLQNNIDLNQFVASSKTDNFDFGALRTTIQKFYRISGQSTQNIGVLSDVVLPTVYDEELIKEQFLPNSFSNDKITTLKHDLVNNNYQFQQVLKSASIRISNNNYFKLITSKNIYLSKKSISKADYSLNLDFYRKSIANQNSDFILFEDLLKYRNNLNFVSSLKEISLIKKDNVLVENRLDWHESLKKDIYIDEAINVLIDIDNLK